MQGITDIELAALEKIASDSSNLAWQLRAQQQLAELLAAEIRGLKSSDSIVCDIKLGNQTFVLQRAEKEELVRQANMARLAIQQCPRHFSHQGIRCATGCCELFKPGTGSCEKVQPCKPWPRPCGTS